MSGNVNFQGTDEEWDALVEKNKLRKSAMKKQTAVHWLLIAMTNKLSSDIGPHFLDLFDQALEMEKEQIIEAVNYGFSDWGGWKDSQEYYTSTYE